MFIKLQLTKKKPPRVPDKKLEPRKKKTTHTPTLKHKTKPNWNTRDKSPYTTASSSNWTKTPILLYCFKHPKSHRGIRRSANSWKWDELLLPDTSRTLICLFRFKPFFFLRKGIFRFKLVTLLQH